MQQKECETSTLKTSEFVSEENAALNLKVVEPEQDSVAHVQAENDAKMKVKVKRSFSRYDRPIKAALALSFAMITGGVLYQNRIAQEQKLQSFRRQAEVLEFQRKFGQASNFWHSAISVAHSLSDKPKLIADMHLRAATDEISATMQSESRVFHAHVRTPALNSGAKTEQPYMDEVNTQREFFYQEARNDLLSALKTYESIPHTQSDQLRLLRMLIPLLERKVQFDMYFRSNAFLVCGNRNFTQQDMEDLKQKGLRALETGHFDTALTDLRTFLSQTRSSAAIVDPIFREVSKHPSDNLTPRLIPFVYEIIYYNQAGTDTLIYAYDWLDKLVGQSGDPKSFEHRLKCADSALAVGDLHGAIIEYRRALAIKDDVGTRTKLLAALKMEFGQNQQHSAATYSFIDACKKLYKLNKEVYGPDSIEAMYVKLQLGIAYGVANNLEKAAKELGSFKKTTPDYDVVEHVAIYQLAELYMKQGNYDLALATYNEGLNFDAKCKIYSHGVWQRIAELQATAGKYSEAKESLAVAAQEGGVDAFQSGPTFSPSSILE